MYMCLCNLPHFISYSVHFNCTSFLKSLSNGRACWKDLQMNLLSVVSIMFNFVSFYFVYSVSILMMASYFTGFASIPLFVR